MNEDDSLRPNWDLRGIEERAEAEIMYSTQAVEDAAAETSMEPVLHRMAKILSGGSSIESVSLELANGHTWKVSRSLGLISATFLCDGDEDSAHSAACTPPEALGDGGLDFLTGDSDASV